MIEALLDPADHRALTGARIAVQDDEIVTISPDWKKVAHRQYSKFLHPHAFEWWATFTFKEERHPEAADKSFRFWVNNLNRDLYGKHWNKRPPYGVKWVRAMEWQKRDVIHYHALLSGLKTSEYTYAHQWARFWGKDKMECGFARIEVIKGDQDAVKTYISKYVAKDGELDFSRNFSHGITLDLANGKILAPRFETEAMPSSPTRTE